MSAMEQMLGNMLKSILPPEVMAMLTQEKLQEVALRINDYLNEQTAFQNNVYAMLSAMDGKIDFLLGRDIDDDNGNNYNDWRTGSNRVDGNGIRSVIGDSDG